MTIALMNWWEVFYDHGGSGRLAALYFDRIATFTGLGWDLPESNSGRELREQFRHWLHEKDGLVLQVELKPETAHDAAEPIAAALREFRANRSLLQPWWRNFGVTAEIPKPYIAAIPADFVTTKLIEAVEETGLGRLSTPPQFYSDSLLYTGKPVGELYWSLLLDIVCTLHATQWASDAVIPIAEVASWSHDQMVTHLAGSVSLDGLNRLRPDVRGLGAILAIKTCAPRSIEDIPWSRILEFREEYRAELTSFQEYLQAFLQSEPLTDELPRGATPEMLKQRLEVQYERRLLPAIKELENALRTAKLDIVWTSLSVRTATPPALAALAGHALSIGGAMEGIVIGSGFAFALLDIIRQQSSDTRKRMASSPFAYLINAKHLDRRRAIRRMRSAPAMPKNFPRS